jgi:glycine cleavage system T protein (aminomethyltransferase)
MRPAYHSDVPGSPSNTEEDPRPSLRSTPLLAEHERLGATLTGFAGWRMPLRYAGETAEHQAVRRAAGLFDLSHMGEIVVTGPGAAAALDHALTGRLSAVTPGRARYTMMCAEGGGVLDDLVVYRTGDEDFMVVANAANTQTVVAELQDRASAFKAQVTDRTDGYALIAIQGPEAVRILAPLTDLDLGEVKYYAGYRGTVAGRPAFVARTGYTGEDGFELFTTPEDAGPVWAALTEAGSPAGLVPAGLAARDTLRLEAGMPLYGNELGPDTTPYDAGLGRVVKLDKPDGFVGGQALAERAKATPSRVLAGLTMASRRVPRHGYPVLAGGQQAGIVTSGAPSPTLGVPIAMAYLTPDAADAGELAVDIRGRAEPARLTELPFYRRSRT